MASGALDSSGQQHQDLEASVSSKLFNSGRPLRSFIDAGDSSDTSVQPPIDPEDDITQSRTANASAVKGNPLSSNFNAAAATPRTIQGNHEGDNGDAIVEYPPTSSQTSNSTPNSALSPSRHPHLLPQHANADPSSSSGGRSVNNSSGNSSFEYGGARQDRLAVNHPGSSDNAHYTIQSATNSNTGLLQPSFGDYDGGGPSTSSDMNTFTRVSGGKATAQVFGTQPVGVIGVHKPREIIRLDRDYTSGEICQFWSGFPLELEGRVGANHEGSTFSHAKGYVVPPTDHSNSASERYERT